MFGEWREMLLECMARIAAYIDFGEDEGVEADVLASAFEKVQFLYAYQILYHAFDDT